MPVVSGSPSKFELDVQKRRERLVEHKKVVSAKISESVRVISVAYLLIFFAVRFHQVDGSDQLYVEHRSALITMAALGLLALIADYFQYVFSYYAAKRAEKRETAQYPAHDPLVFLRDKAFGTKQMFAFLGALVLLYLFMKVSFEL